MKQIKIKLNVKRLNPSFPDKTFTIIGEYCPERDVRTQYTIQYIKLTIKNQTHRKMLLRHLNSTLEISLIDKNIPRRSYLHKENGLFYLSSKHTYSGKSQRVSLYTLRDRTIFTGELCVGEDSKNYLAILPKDLQTLLPDGIYKIVFKKHFYKCKKAGSNLFFGILDRIR